jgi:hypothetical protein
MNWPDGFVADYLVHFGSTSASTINGYDATVAADTADANLSLLWDNFGASGFFLNTATYTGGHVGDSATFHTTLAPENWWHEWVDDGSGWSFGNGASFDTLGDGDRIGWVFGLATTPVPEPASTVFLIGTAGCALLRRRRRACGERGIA